MKKLLFLICFLCINVLLYSAVYKSVSISAGGLSTALTVTEKNNLTDLTVTGTIDARDVKYMRDSIPNLAILDIASTNIQAYNGTAGTDSLTTLYKAAEMPRKSFCYPNLTGKASLKSVYLPNTISSIAFHAFKSCIGLNLVTIPNTVTNIESQAFLGCTGITNLTLPDAVTTIGEWAFGSCKGLTSLSMPNFMTSIGNYVFYGCSGLSDVIIPLSVKTIGKGSFENCTGLTNLIVPNAVTSIGMDAFKSCSKLANITLSNAVTSIGSSAFFGCTGLSNIWIGQSISAIGDLAFGNCSKLSSIYTYSSTPLVLTSSVFQSINKSTCTLHVPVNAQVAYRAATAWNEFTTISENSNLNSYSKNVHVIPGRLYTIFTEPEKASITNLTMTGSIDARDLKYLRDNMSNLTLLDVNAMNIQAYTGSEGTNAVLTSYPANQMPESSFSYLDHTGKTTLKFLTLPNSITTIGVSAFEGCTGLSDMIIPSSVTSIGNSAFKNCNGIVSVSFFNFLKSIGSSAFSGCTKLTSVNLPNTVTSIGSSTFYNCTALTNLTLSESIASIGDNAFANCINLSSCSTYSTTPIELTSSVFQSVGNSCILYVPVNTITAYQAAAVWNGFNSIIEDIKLSVQYKSINIQAGKLSTALTSKEKANITDLTVSGLIDARDVKFMRDSIPNLANLDISSTTIQAYSGVAGTDSVNSTYSSNEMPRFSFRKNDNAGSSTLKTIVLPNSITSIGEGAFISCTGLTNLTIPNSVATLGDYSFYGCSNLTTITLPTAVVAIGSYSFGNCSKLTNCMIMGPLTKIGPWTFSNCIGLTTLTIPNTVNAIGDYAFYGCSNLTGITLPANVAVIGESAFNGCSSMSSLTIPTSIFRIEKNTYSNCNGLTSVSLPNSIVTIGDWAFLNCNNLTTVTIPNSVDSIGVGAFYNCSKLTSMIIPNSVTTMGKGAFYNCSGLNSLNISEFITTIESNTFACCTGLTDISIPNSVKRIDTWAFFKCTGLRSVSIPNAVDSIGMYAFYDCSGLTSIVTFDATPIVLSSSAFQNVNKITCTLVVPEFSKITYQATSVWNSFTKIVEVPEGHFKVAFTGNGQDHMNLNILTATLNGLSLEAGDEIAAFDDAICCGKVVLTQPLNMGDVNSFVTISTSKTDVALANGFTSGNSIMYKYWDSSKNEEVSVVAPSYFDAVTGLATSIPTYLANGTAFVQLSGIDPIANAGSDQSVNEGTMVTMDGSSSFDSNNQVLTYIWTAPSGISLSSSTAAKPTFIAPEVKADTIYTLSLVVNEGTISSFADYVSITVKQVNKVPVANAGVDQLINERQFITLDATASSDGDGNELTYLWTAPVGIILSSSTASKPTFKAPEVQKDTAYTFSLVVNDHLANSTADQVTITVKQKIYKQQIALSSGWNLVSFNVLSSKTNLKDIFQPLIDGGKLRIVKDETGKSIENFGSFGGWKNAIGNFSPSEGYKVKMSGVDTLSLEGDPIPLPQSISLKAGWNIISYPCENAQDAMSMIQPLINAGMLVKVTDESGKSIENFGSYGGWVNNIGNFVAGKGYNVNVLQSSTLSISSSELRSTTFQASGMETLFFKNVFEGNGVDHMNINLISLDSSVIQTDDEIGIFDGNSCVGSARVTSENVATGRVSISTSCNDGLESTVNGFIPGNSITIKLYSNGLLYNLNVEKLAGSATFEKYGSFFAKVESKMPTDTQSIVEPVQIRYYPNPFTDAITIDVINTNSDKLTVEIYNLFGQIIKRLYDGDSAGKVNLTWNGTDGQGHKVNPGAYICKVNEKTNKIIYNGKK